MEETPMISQVKSAIEAKLAEMNAAVEVTFISSKSFSIHSEDAGSFNSAKSVLALANQTMTEEVNDAECGFFAYYAL